MSLHDLNPIDNTHLVLHSANGDRFVYTATRDDHELQGVMFLRPLGEVPPVEDRASWVAEYHDRQRVVADGVLGPILEAVAHNARVPWVEVVRFHDCIIKTPGGPAAHAHLERSLLVHSFAPRFEADGRVVPHRTVVYLVAGPAEIDHYNLQLCHDLCRWIDTAHTTQAAAALSRARGITGEA